ncbi:hypothetical protein Tco_0540166 [Tanacetum coccineum]
MLVIGSLQCNDLAFRVVANLDAERPLSLAFCTAYSGSPPYLENFQDDQKLEVLPCLLSLTCIPTHHTADRAKECLYEQYFEFSRVRVPFSTLLLAVLDHFRVHISQLVQERMSSILDPVLPDDFFSRLATTWEYSGFHSKLFKIPEEKNVVTMSEYLRFPFLDGATIEQGDALEEDLPRGLFRESTRIVAPQSLLSANKMLRCRELHDSREDPKKPHVSIASCHDLQNTTHTHTVAMTRAFGESRGHGETVETHPNPMRPG